MGWGPVKFGQGTRKQRPQGEISLASVATCPGMNLQTFQNLWTQDKKMVLTALRALCFLLRLEFLQIINFFKRYVMILFIFLILTFWTLLKYNLAMVHFKFSLGAKFKEGKKPCNPFAWWSGASGVEVSEGEQVMLSQFPGEIHVFRVTNSITHWNTSLSG